MASDGCQPVAWAGRGGFTHLLYRPDGRQGESYGAARHGHGDEHVEQQQQQEAGSSGRGDRTGTWNGPAPRGYVAEPMHAQDESRAAAAKPVNDPQHLLLPGAMRLPLLGLGTFQLQSADAVRKALELGYRHIDCAAFYANQKVIGEGLKDFLAQGKRGELFITSKIWNDQHRPADVRASAERTIADLGCGHLDLLLVHWPCAWRPGTQEVDPDVTIQQTWRALEELVDAGLVRFIGVSNFSLKQVEEVLAFARIKPVVNQIELHPLLAQRKLVGVCLRKGVHCVAYSPLGVGNDTLLQHPAVLEVAAETGKSPAQVLLKWNVQRGVPVIPKAGSEPHLAENIDGLFNWRLTWDQKAKLDALDAGTRLCTGWESWHTFDDPEEGGALKPSKVL